MKRSFLGIGPILILGIVLAARGHDRITTSVTWSREISRIFYTRCASCHHEGGMAFSMMTFAEVRPWAVAIKEEALRRRMPPWGAVKGFGEFRNDQALTPEQLELITSWVDGGVPEGDPKELPSLPKPDDSPKQGGWFEDGSHSGHWPGEIAVSGDFTLDRAFTLDGLLPKTVTDHASLQITADLPNGTVEPLLWLYDYKAEYGHPFLLRTPLDLPAGTVIRGIPPGWHVILLGPALPAESKALP